jgi:phospholipase/carboxylesterase
VNDFSSYEFHPRGAATGAVIWLHGLGADGTDFVPLIPHLDLPSVRFVFPNAPLAPVTLNQGHVMPSWYDIRTLDPGSPDREDPSDVRRSAEGVRALIAREVARGVPESRIVLAGFSQGGAVALHAGLRHPRRLAGLLALSTYLVLESTLVAELGPEARSVPVWFGHGTQDDVVRVERGRHAHDVLHGLGLSVRWSEYRMGHQVVAAEVQAIGEFLRERLADVGAP